MPDSDFDDWMDAQLRNVPVPDDLDARLRAVDGGAGGLNGEPLPGPRSRDARMDALLRNVEIPRGFHRRLQMIARGGILPLSWHDASRAVWAAAASLLIFGSAGAYLIVSRGGETNTVSLDEKHLAEQAPVLQQQLGEPGSRQVGSRSKSGDRSSHPSGAARAESARGGTKLAENSPPDSSPRRQRPITVALGNEPEPAASNPQDFLQNVVGLGSSIRQAIEARQRISSALGAGGKFEALPALDVLEPPIARGISPPRVRGYDLLFQLKHGEHPFVNPAADKSLEVSPVPFTFRATSYDRVAARIASGRLPASDEVRVEDFLAAQQYPLPTAPAGGIALHVAGCPTPLGEPGRQMLQLSVQAATGRAVKRPPVRLLVVIETSPTTATRTHGQLVARALAKLARRLLPQDRITLIGFSDMARVLVDDATRDDLSALDATHLFAATSGSANLQTAVQAATQAATALPSQATRQVVFVTSRGTLMGTPVDDIKSSLAALSATGTPWEIIGLSSGDNKPWQDSPAWRNVAELDSGKARTVASADELFLACLGALENRSSTVAHGVSMRTTFNPKTVGGYRLLGHESATLTGDAGDPFVVDLHLDQTVTNLYELWLKPNAKGDLGSIEITWHNPGNGQPQRRVQPLRQKHFSASFAEAPAWLQQGVLAARTAEFLRNSEYVPNSRRLGQLLELTGQVDRSAAETPEFRSLIHLIEQADRLQ